MPSPGADAVALVQALRRLGFIVWMCSFIQHSQKYRDQCAAFREQLAVLAGYTMRENPNAPCRNGLFLLHPGDRVGDQGKAAACSMYNTRVLVDDRHDICYEAERWGILAYQVMPSRAHHPRYVARSAQEVRWQTRSSGEFYSHPICQTLDHFRRLIISEVGSGAFAWKYQAVCEQRQF